jgi:uncharacterized protein (TIGR03437 family)
MVLPTRIGSKRTLQILTVLSFTFCAAFAQTEPFSGRCLATSSPTLVRAEGLTERLGDIQLQCSGSVPGAVFANNLTLFLPVSVTNRVDANNLTRDTVLSVDYGSGFIPTAIAGQISNRNITFNGLNFAVPASGNLNLKISNLRAAVNQLAPVAYAALLAPTPVTISISSSFPIDQAQLIVAYAQVGLLATLYSTGITCYGSPVPETISLANLFAAGTAFASTRVTEGFASAFEPRTAGADSGTRFLVKYSGFPANTHLYVPDAVAGSDAQVPTAGGDLGFRQAVGQYVPGSGTLVLVRVQGADSTGAGGFAVGAPQGGNPLVLNSASEVPLTNGSGYAVYEVADANGSVQESAQFPTFVGLSSVTASAVAQESVSLAPVSSAANASQTAAIPRFAAVPPAADCNALGDCAAAYFPKLMVDATPIQIAAIADGGIMTTAPGYIPIRNGGGGILQWNVSINYLKGSGWLFLDYPSGQNSGSVRVWSQTQNLSAGTYQATLTVNAGSAGSQTIPLTLTVAAAPPPPPPAPVVTVSKVVNAATFAVTPLVSGSLGTVMGSHLSGKNVSVTFDGIAAALLYTGEGQINLRVPAGLGAKTSATMVVKVDDASSAPMTVALAAAWPAIFAHGVFNQDNAENTPAAAAKSGTILQIFATGIPASATVAVQIGDRKDLVPLYAGEAPTAPGVQQVNVAIPDGAGSGAAALIICATTGGQQYCSTGNTIAVVQ